MTTPFIRRGIWRSQWPTLAAGTAAAPALTFTGDLDTGVFSPTANTFAISTGGTERLRVDSAGNVDISTGDASIHGVRVGRGVGAIATNTAVGASALNANTTGCNNSAVGLQALLCNTTGNFNSAVGVDALRLNTTGSSNSAVGLVALCLNTTGCQNSAVGVEALRCNTTGNFNSAVGVGALSANTTSCFNSALGNGALLSNTTGCCNSAVGASALRCNTTGSGNVAVGVSSLRCNTTGIDNIAVGVQSLFDTSTGGNNNAIGTNALLCNTTGCNNVALGHNAGDTITTGSGNTMIGSGSDSGSVTAANRIAIGVNVVATADNRITIGSGANIAELDLDGADTSWAASSDMRLKENIHPSTIGLALINDLRPVNFQWKRRCDINPSVPGHDDSTARVHGDPGATYLGFIAQEAQSAIEAHDAQTVRMVESRENGILTAAPGALIPVLVRAVQELSDEVATLKSKLN
jgi:hypothetical protein